MYVVVPQNIVISTFSFYYRPISKFFLNSQRYLFSVFIYHDSFSSMRPKHFKSKSIDHLHAKDIESLFAMLILSLKLTEKGQKESGILFSKYHPFSFTVEQATNAMEAMNITINNGTTVTSIDCGIHRDKAMEFLQQLMTAKLLHCPGNRTRDSPHKSSLLQPTAKGIHFVERYCRKNGIRDEDVTVLLLSNYNTMRCISLDRNYVSDELPKSEAFAHLLFQRFMGPSPNVYDPANPPDDINKNSLATIYGDSVDFSLYSPTSLTFDVGPTSSGISPYAHRYFTHPDSESLTQYYVSNKGVRLFANHQFYLDGTPLREEYTFTGKAACQWLTECTDIVYPFEAITLANAFLEHMLIEPIFLIPSISRANGIITRDQEAFYKLTRKGYSVCLWDREFLSEKNDRLESAEGRSTNSSGSTVVNVSSDEVTNSLYAQVNLESILEEPGLSLLFREFLELNHCQENLLFVTDMKQITHMYRTLASIRMSNQEKAIHKYETSVLSAIYVVFSRYLAVKAPYGLNIDHKVKKNIVDILTAEVNVTSQNLVDAIEPLLEKAKQIVLKMMYQDSLQKFVRSPAYQNAIRTMSPFREDEHYRKV